MNNVDEAPLCDAIDTSNNMDMDPSGGSLWPTADLVSTFSRKLEVENGVIVDGDGNRANATWTCPAAPGRFVPVCMLAPCVFSSAESESTYEQTNSYNYGTHDVTCTCPLVEADVEYQVFGGTPAPEKRQNRVTTSRLQQMRFL